MQCPNCGNRLLPDEEFCSECGQDVRNDSESDQRQNGEKSSSQEKLGQMVKDVRESAFFKEAVDFLKVSILKPAALVNSAHSRQLKVPLIVIGVAILIIALFTFIGLRVATSQVSSFYGETFIPFSVFFNLILIFIGAFAIYFVLLAIMNRLTLKNSVNLQKLAHDYLALSVWVVLLWLVGLFSIFITLYEVGAFLFALGIALLVIIPIYMFMVHVKEDNGKLDLFHSVLLYSVFAVIAYLIILRLLLTQFSASIFGLF